MTRAAPITYPIPAARLRWAVATLKTAGIRYSIQKDGLTYRIVTQDAAAAALLAPIVAYQRKGKRARWFRFHFESTMLTLSAPVAGWLFFGPLGAAVALGLALLACHLDARRDADPAPYGRWFWAQGLVLVGLLLAVAMCAGAFVRGLR